MQTAYDGPTADVGVIGGTGLYSLMADATRVPVDTPWGPPSDPLLLGEIAGRSVAFVPRHGRDHRHAPHQVNYRANLWALRAVGVRQVLAPCAVGSLRPELGPGSLVLLDQVVDRTAGRQHTFYSDGPPVHVAFGDPYCPRGRAAVADAATAVGEPLHASGTLVVINGPRFSSRAESLWHAAQGWTVVGMTGQPEAGLARELGLCYTALALVTDLDAGVEGSGGVSHEEVLRVFRDNIERLRGLLHEAVSRLPADPDCTCPRVGRFAEHP
jgi:5'-methylthioadenosine phosphorylase